MIKFVTNMTKGSCELTKVSTRIGTRNSEVDDGALAPDREYHRRSRGSIPPGRGVSMEMTWVAIAASLAMGLAAALFFVFAVKREWFRDIEDAKYQVFWSDRDGLQEARREAVDGSQSEKK